MDPVSPLPALAALAVAIATTRLLAKRFGAPDTRGRFATIDGLRGYLAFFVFLHHGCIWYFYLRSGEWAIPPSNLYTHFGQSSVALFFMITGFLFWAKLLNAGGKRVDWTYLYASRLLRLGPLYLFAISLLFVIVACLARGRLEDPAMTVIGNALQWIGFTISGAPDLNGIAETSLIIASVTWSLPYEWLFYFLLPLLSLLIGSRPPAVFLALGILAAAWLLSWTPNMYLFAYFAAGMIAAYCVRHPRLCQFAISRSASPIALSCLIAAGYFFPTSYAMGPLTLLSAAFILIACGTSLYGVLLNHISRTLGELAYSIYLLHGLLLFVSFRFVIGFDKARELSAITHWATVIAGVPLLICICFATFRRIEQPAMRKSIRLAELFRTPLLRRQATTMVTPVPTVVAKESDKPA